MRSLLRGRVDRTEWAVGNPLSSSDLYPSFFALFSAIAATKYGDRVPSTDLFCIVH